MKLLKKVSLFATALALTLLYGALRTAESEFDIETEEITQEVAPQEKVYREKAFPNKPSMPTTTTPTIKETPIIATEKQSITDTPTAPSVERPLENLEVPKNLNLPEPDEDDFELDDDDDQFPIIEESIERPQPEQTRSLPQEQMLQNRDSIDKTTETDGQDHMTAEGIDFRPGNEFAGNETRSAGSSMPAYKAFGGGEDFGPPADPEKFEADMNEALASMGITPEQAEEALSKATEEDIRQGMEIAAQIIQQIEAEQAAAAAALAKAK